MRLQHALIAATLTCLITVLIPTLSQAAPNASTMSFNWWWSYWDRPVETGQVNRSWTWGAEVPEAPAIEAYSEGVLAYTSPTGESIRTEGKRNVKYYDKARMEFWPDVAGFLPTDNLWRVTTGLLATELMTGNLQLGDTLFEPHQPSQVPVAGDPGSGDITPSYAIMGQHMADAALPEGTVITQTLDAAGIVGTDARFAEERVLVEDVSAPTGHGVATVFWAWMNQVGVVDVNPDYPPELVSKSIFPNPFYATGYPTTDAYWTQTRVGGQEQEVLVQCFERRCLTYTPANAAQWQVEMANIGQHYYQWRYTEIIAETSS